jgi:hypothetical protein
MSATSLELKEVISGYYVQLNKMNESELSFKPGVARWSKKEILGHLIDSAQNNLRRFIVSQYEQKPLIIYNQDDWVRINNYQDMDTGLLIELWFLQNQQICHLLEGLGEEQLEKKSLTDSEHTVGWLAKDYIRHLRHHMHQILNLEAVDYP